MKKELKIIRRWLVFFIVALFLSGLTAIPLEQELALLTRSISTDTTIGAWIERVYLAIVQTNRHYPFLAYGYDWLAFAHFVLAILFIGPLIDPVKNKWVIQFGIIACILIIPYAMIAGYFRGIPLGWRLIDCAFGVIGVVPLSICLELIQKLEKPANEFSYES